MTQLILLDDYRDPQPDLLKEANHRIANQLSMLVSTIQMQIAALRSGPQLLRREEVGTLLRETAGKIVGIAHLHRRMADHHGNGEIELGDYLIEIVGELAASLSLGERLSVRHRSSGGCVVDTDQAQTLSLILSEIVMNAVKYAHPSGLPVAMCIVCARSGDGSIAIEICDDGVGLPEGFDTARDGGVGFKLIRTLVARLGATLHIESDDLGLCLQIALPPAAATLRSNGVIAAASALRAQPTAGETADSVLHP